MSLPRWPSFFLGMFAVLATASLLQGIVDVVIPVFTGRQPFGFLFQLTDAYGPVVFALYVFVHNLGLACLVPGYGFLAAWFEKHRANRAIIGWLLAGSVVLSLLVALEFLLQAAPRFDMSVAIPLFVVESIGVLILAIPSARLLSGFIPTPHYDWSLVSPFRRLAGPLVASATLLAIASAAETWAILF